MLKRRILRPSERDKMLDEVDPCDIARRNSHFHELVEIASPSATKLDHGQTGHVRGLNSVLAQRFDQQVPELPFAELDLGDERPPIVGRPEWLAPITLPFVEGLDAFDVAPVRCSTPWG